jgi:hypothetical protein
MGMIYNCGDLTSKIKIGQDTWRGRGPDKEKRKPKSDRGLKRGKYNLKKLGI